MEGPSSVAPAPSPGIGSAPESAGVALEARTRVELKVNYAEIVRGFRKNDPEVWLRFLVPDFTLKLFDGSVQDRQWVVDYVRHNATAFKVLRLSMVIEELVFDEDDVTAVVEQKSSRTFHDENAQAHRLDVGALQRETWTKTPAGWRLKCVEEWKVLYLRKEMSG